MKVSYNIEACWCFACLKDVFTRLLYLHMRFLKGTLCTDRIKLRLAPNMRMLPSWTTQPHTIFLFWSIFLLVLICLFNFKLWTWFINVCTSKCLLSLLNGLWNADLRNKEFSLNEMFDVIRWALICDLQCCKGTTAVRFHVQLTWLYTCDGARCIDAGSRCLV